MAAVLVLGGGASALPAQTSPHYFGPSPNWANSPLTLPAATVTVGGNFTTRAAAVATVGANGSITSITVTDGGTGYTQASVTITGPGSGAAAKATIVKKGAIVAIDVTTPGSRYTAPKVVISGGGAGSGGAATAYGGVGPGDAAVTIGDAGAGYTAPTLEFDLPDAPDGVRAEGFVDFNQTTGSITAVHVTQPGSGYATAPGVTVLNGTRFDPIPLDPDNPLSRYAMLSASMFIDKVNIDAPGSGYTQNPTVTFTDPTGTGATARATLDNGVIASIDVTKPGSGYVTPGGIKKFTDPLPGLCEPASCPSSGKYIPLAKPQVKTYNGVEADEYVIGLVQYRTSFSSSMINGALVRGYVQIDTGNVTGSKHVALQNELMNGAKVNVTVNGAQAYGVTPPQFLGPVIVAQKDRPVRIVFHNLLPKGADGDLFLPVDSTIMGSGPNPSGSSGSDPLNPACTQHPKDGAKCFVDNRATLHLHGGITPWISDGTPHQWITPAGENTTYPEGVSVENVPDMLSNGSVTCDQPTDGCQTFYYTNQQSARLMFYHDHAWGITRLNVYAGEAAGYVIEDDTEKKLVSSGTIPGPADTIPLIVQDRTFVPGDAQLIGDPVRTGVYNGQDPTWDKARWGGKDSLWYHHVYMPAQNPGDPTGMSSFGRWMYGPWFWPPANPPHGPIANPDYNPNCSLDIPSTWQYQTDPFCEPELIPGTPNISAGMEQFNDTPIVNGTAYPTVTLDPKTYRLRILNAANDRFWNLQWYVADSTGTEVALKAAEVAAAQTDPVVFPTPDTTLSPAGPSWIQIGTEGGFLPAPVVVPNQPITWITDPTRFDVGNVDKHSLLLAPAERADTIVDFSKFRGKTLILYNDAPAAFPARIACYDYYTGGPDLTPACAPSTLPGYGPNTRTIMQVKISTKAAGSAFNLSNLNAAFKHKADGSGVFESGQHPIIVGQAAYNSAYGTSFASGGFCSSPASTGKCDGFARISQQGGDPFTFDTLKGATNGTWSKVSINLQPKAIHDEMNSSAFDEYGRMQANLGVEAVPANPGAQNVNLFPYTTSPTEVIDATSLPTGDVKVQPISSGTDGSQIWKITHNGVDTHPIHFHLYDVQIVNRVTWDNIIIPPDLTELGWKDTIRVSPLEDTIVALRPVIPKLPFDIPNSVHALSPMMQLGDPLFPGTGLTDPQGNPIDMFNHLINFGWEYVYHCHILSHEEMDMMRPVLVALPPKAASNLGFSGGTLSWRDNSLSETAFQVQSSPDGTTWTNVTGARITRVLGAPNTSGTTESVTGLGAGLRYRVVAENTVGDTTDYGTGTNFPFYTVKSYSAPLSP